MEKRKQQCIYFFRGTCQRGDQCRYEHQIGDDGRPVPVGPEILQRFDDAAKRYNETRAQAQAKPKAAPRGGVTASMIILEPDDLQNGIVVNAAQALDDDMNITPCWTQVLMPSLCLCIQGWRVKLRNARYQVPQSLVPSFRSMSLKAKRD